jgi:hypothetical protein
MISALNSALSGLHSASQKFDRAASDIVRGGTGSSAQAQTGADDTDLVDGLVGLKEAEVQFKASAKLIGAIARTEKHLLDILA